MIIKKDSLAPKDYFNETQEKKIIVLHHTAGASAQSSINWWKSQKERIATTIVIDRNGTIYEAFPIDKWAHGLGIKTAQFNKFALPNINPRLNQIAIQIEIANYGGLTKKGDKFYTFSGKEINFKNVQEYPTLYKGYKYYEKYTNEQIEAVKEYILYAHKLYPMIPLKYNAEMWDVSIKALKGYWGIWTHTSFRSDKNDCHPQPELITMLKNLENEK